MKKILALVLAVLILGSMSLAFASTSNPTAGEKLQAYGLVDGMDEEGNLGEDVQLTRAMMIKLLETLLGEEEYAAECNFPSSFIDVSDDAWYAPYVAYAELMKYTNGMGDGTFAPDALVSKQMVATYLLRALGYEGVWNTALADAYALGIDVNAEGNLVRGDAFDMMLDSLAVKGKYSDISLGLELGIDGFKVPGAPVVTTASIKTAVALNSEIIEVVLDKDIDAPAAVDASLFKLTEKTNTLGVKSAKFAEWDTDNYTVLVTLNEDMAFGKLYTLTSGDVDIDFSGLDVDKIDPTVESAISTEYNEVTVTMNEAFDISDIKATIVKSSDDTAKLTVLDMEYGEKDELVITTAEQTNSVSYEVEIDGLTDLAGNVADNDLTATFAGIGIDTDEQKVVSVNVVDSITVDVTFDINVDVKAAIDSTNYNITAEYDAKDIVVIRSAAMKLDSNNDVIKNVVRLTLATDSANATLYKLEVLNVGTLYGQKLDLDNDTLTFAGIGEDVDEPTAVLARANSNTEIIIQVIDDSDEIAKEYDASLFSITEKYGDKEKLTIVAVKEVDAEERTITLTTSAQKDGTLYELTVNKGLADKFGNVTTDELTAMFAGIDTVDEIDLVTVTTLTKTSALVEFNRNYGTGALSVASYNIDGDIGHPTKVEALSTNDGYTTEQTNNTVKITFTETTYGDIYELTVNNVYNSDGVAMSSKGITDKFAGKGDESIGIALESVTAIDNQTLRLEFDDNVADLEGITLGANLINTEFDITPESGAAITTVEGYVYEDPNNSKALLVTVVTNDMFDNKTVGADEFTLTVNDSVITNINKGTSGTDNIVKFAENTLEPEEITIEAIVALDSMVLKVYFNQAVRKVEFDVADNSITDEFAFVDLNDNGTFDAATDFEITNAYADNEEMNRWIFVLESPMVDATPNEIDFVVNNPTTGISTHLLTNVLGFTNDDGSAIDVDSVVEFDIDPATNLIVQFIKNTTSIDYIDDIDVAMLDSRTFKIYYPEDMDITTALNGTNYEIFTEDAATNAPTYIDEDANAGVSGTQISITKAVWENDDNSVVLTTNDELGSYSILYMKVSDNIKNKAGNKTVWTKTTHAPIIRGFAVSTEDNEITIAKVKAYNDTNISGGYVDTLVITLDQLTTDTIWDENKFLADFDVTVDGALLTAGDITGGSMVAASNITEDAMTNGDNNIAFTDEALEITVELTSDTIATNSAVEVVISGDLNSGFKFVGKYNNLTIKDNDVAAVSATVSEGANITSVTVTQTTAKGTLTLATNPIANETMTIGSTVYTFVDTADYNAAGEIELGGTLVETQTNLLAALAGTDAKNSANIYVTASAFDSNVTTLTATDEYDGAFGNTVITTETFTAVTNEFDSSTLGTVTAGSDSIVVVLSEAYTDTTIDNSDVNTDFNIGTAAIVGTTVETNETTLTLAITESDEQINGASLNIIAGAITTDADGISFDTTTELIVK